MARGKPLILSRKPGSEVRARKKSEAESSFRTSALPSNPPAALAGMKAARAAWRSLMKAHGQLPGELFNALDRDFVIGYCLAVQARQRALDLEKKVALEYVAGAAGLSVLLAVRVELRQTIRLVADLEKQIYASPKSRGGVSPEPREATPEEIVKRELEDLNNMLGE
jgi:hypothetical protein